jgi:arsenate reductase
MGEKGIGISNESLTMLTEEMGRDAQMIVTMGCGDACPVHIGKRYLDWDVEKPAGKDVEAVRSIRDEIEQRVKELIADLISR